MSARWQCLNPRWHNSRCCHHQDESEWLSEQMMGTNRGQVMAAGSEIQSRWQNSRWLPSSSWVRMNEFESDWISLKQSGVRCFWVNMREDNKVFESKWQCLNPIWQNSRWLPSLSWIRMNEWSCFLCKWLEPILGKCEWVWEEILRWLNPRWPNSRWQNWRWLPSPS